MRLVEMTDKGCIGAVSYDDVIEADCGDKVLLVFGDKYAVFAIEELAFGGDDDVFVFVGADDVSESSEGAEVEPAAIEFNGKDVVGFFHNCEINADFGEFREPFFESFLLSWAIPGGLDFSQGFGGIRLELIEVGEDGFCFPYKHTGVPEVDVFCKILLGGFFIGFFFEGFNGVNFIFAARAFTRVATLYVAELSAWEGGFYPEGNHTVRVVIDEGECILDDLLKDGCRLDNLVGGDNCNSGIGVEFGEDGSGEADSACGVSDDGFSNNIAERQTGDGFADGIGVAGIGQDNDVSCVKEGRQAFEAKSQEGATFKELEDLFRTFSAAEGPQPFTGTACHNHCIVHSRFPFMQRQKRTQGQPPRQR